MILSKNVAIIGAGITGNKCLLYEKQNPHLNVTIYEATNRPGGKIQTYRKDGYTIELGPESYLGRKTIMTDIANEIGLGNDLITNTTGQSYIYAKINYIRYRVVLLWAYRRILNLLSKLN